MRIAYGSVAQPGQPFGYGIIGQMLKWSLEQAGAEIVTGFGYDLSVVVGQPWSWPCTKRPPRRPIGWTC